MKDPAWDIYRKPLGAYQPRTQHAALRAFGLGMLERPAFLVRMLAIQPLNVEPWDLLEIERVLARKDLDIGTLLTLIPVLRTLLSHPDREVALSAAEDLGIVEHRYLSRIESLRRALALTTDCPEAAPLRRELARELYELALINRALPPLRNYYLKDALEHAGALAEQGCESPADLLLRLDMLEELGLHDQVHSILERRDSEALLGSEPCLERRAANAFYRRDFLRVAIVLEHAGPGMDELRQFWTGRAPEDVR